MAQNFPNINETGIKIQEAQRAPNKLNPNCPTPRHIIKYGHSGSSCCGSVLMNSTSIHENERLIPGLARWVKDLALP